MALPPAQHASAEARSERVSALVVLAAAAALVFSVIVYCQFLVIPVIEGDPALMSAAAPANALDHRTYVDYIQTFDQRLGAPATGIDNNIGIAALYHQLLMLVSADVSAAPWLSLVLNTSAILIALYAWCAIRRWLCLPDWTSLIFFAAGPWLYFSQLINKDALSAAIILLGVLATMRRNIIALLALVVVAALVRLQLPLFLIGLWFLAGARRWWPTALAIYVSCALAAAAIERTMPIFMGDSAASGGMGISALVQSLNARYGIGALLLNPIRVVQYFFDLCRAVLSGLTQSHSLAELKGAPILLLLLWLLPNYVRLLFGLHRVASAYFRPLLSAIWVFFCVWLINPTINERYLLLITPVIVLLGLAARLIGRPATTPCGHYQLVVGGAVDRRRGA